VLMFQVLQPLSIPSYTVLPIYLTQLRHHLCDSLVLLERFVVCSSKNLLSSFLTHIQVGPSVTSSMAISSTDTAITGEQSSASTVFGSPLLAWLAGS
jgi:hypothetical protein